MAHCGAADAPREGSDGGRGGSAAGGAGAGGSAAARTATPQPLPPARTATRVGPGPASPVPFLPACLASLLVLKPRRLLPASINLIATTNWKRFPSDRNKESNDDNVRRPATIHRQRSRRRRRAAACAALVCVCVAVAAALAIRPAAAALHDDPQPQGRAIVDILARDLIAASEAQPVAAVAAPAVLDIPSPQTATQVLAAAPSTIASPTSAPEPTQSLQAIANENASQPATTTRFPDGFYVQSDSNTLHIIAALIGPVFAAMIVATVAYILYTKGFFAKDSPESPVLGRPAPQLDRNPNAHADQARASGNAATTVAKRPAWSMWSMLSNIARRTNKNAKANQTGIINQHLAIHRQDHPSSPDEHHLDLRPRMEYQPLQLQASGTSGHPNHLDRNLLDPSSPAHPHEDDPALNRKAHPRKKKRGSTSTPDNHHVHNGSHARSTSRSHSRSQKHVASVSAGPSNANSTQHSSSATLGLPQQDGARTSHSRASHRSNSIAMSSVSGTLTPNTRPPSSVINDLTIFVDKSIPPVPTVPTTISHQMRHDSRLFTTSGRHPRASLVDHSGCMVVPVAGTTHQVMSTNAPQIPTGAPSPMLEPETTHTHVSQTNQPQQEFQTNLDIYQEYFELQSDPVDTTTRVSVHPTGVANHATVVSSHRNDALVVLPTFMENSRVNMSSGYQSEMHPSAQQSMLNPVDLQHQQQPASLAVEKRAPETIPEYSEWLESVHTANVLQGSHEIQLPVLSPAQPMDNATGVVPAPEHAAVTSGDYTAPTEATTTNLSAANPGAGPTSAQLAFATSSGMDGASAADNTHTDTGHNEVSKSNSSGGSSRISTDVSVKRRVSKRTKANTSRRSGGASNRKSVGLQDYALQMQIQQLQVQQAHLMQIQQQAMAYAQSQAQAQMQPGTGGDGVLMDQMRQQQQQQQPVPGMRPATPNLTPRNDSLFKAANQGTIIGSMEPSRNMWKLGGLKYVPKEEAKRQRAQRRAAERTRQQSPGTDLPLSSSKRRSGGSISGNGNGGNTSGTSSGREGIFSRLSGMRLNTSSRRKSAARKSMLSSAAGYRSVNGEQSVGVTSSVYDNFHVW